MNQEEYAIVLPNLDDANVTGKLLEYCPPRPKSVSDDAEYLVWLYECVCFNIAQGVGGGSIVGITVRCVERLSN